MKKITKIAATFAATMAVLFGAASCSHDGGASLAALSEKPVITTGGQAKVTYFTNVGDSYSAAGASNDETIVKAKDITIKWGSDVTIFSQCTTGVYTTNTIKGYGVQSDKYTLTENSKLGSDGKTKADFVGTDAEILVVKATLTPVKNFTVKKISGQFVNGKSSETVLFVNGVDSGLEKNKTLDLKGYEPKTAIKGTAGSDVEIVFTIKASSDKGITQVTADDFQWTQVMNDIEIVVEADE